MSDILFISDKVYAVGDGIQLEIEVDTGVWVHCIAAIMRAEPASRRRMAYAAVAIRFSSNHQGLLAERLNELCKVEQPQLEMV